MTAKTLDKTRIFATAKKALSIEAEAINNLKDSLNGDYCAIIKAILNCDGRVVMTGMGKSGLIARKLAATFASTGTSAFFLHPGEAIHGDLGMITEDDLVFAISNSGETEEVIRILPAIKRIGAEIIAITGNLDSTLAKNSNYVISSSVEQEACPHDLAPTASTTAALALGDSVAVTLLELRDFKPEDFALYHPGGKLGKQLLLTVEDVLKIREQNPVVSQDASLKESLFAMTSSGMGAVSVVDESKKLVGVITDGDIRRQLEDSVDVLKMTAQEVMTLNPTVIAQDKLAAEALKIMQEKEIKDLPIVDSENKPVGLINFQDLLEAGVV